MQLPRFSARGTNLGLLSLVLAGVLTGLGCFLAGSWSARWVFWLHSVAGCGVIGLLTWKRRIILRSVRRHGLGIWLLPSLLLLALLAGALLSGLLWSTSGLPALAGESGLTVHAALSAALAVLLLPHARAGWPGFSFRAAAGRRALLQTGFTLGAGFVLWRVTELTSAAARFGGAHRRFTGSREIDSFLGNVFPTNSWLLDDPAPIEPATWRLMVRGAVASATSLTLAELDATGSLTATIDCTSGWYSVQRWQGVWLSKLIETAAAHPEARSIVVRSSTGYSRRFSIARASSMLVATRVGVEELIHEHGAPARLVVPGARGYDWVKWVKSIEVSRLPAWLNWPLPL